MEGRDIHGAGSPEEIDNSNWPISKKCFLCWKILENDLDGVSYRSSEKELQNCKKYLKAQLLENSVGIKHCSKMARDASVCLTCHESSEKLSLVADVLAEVEKELQEVAESFNDHILHFRLESKRRERGIVNSSFNMDDNDIVDDEATCDSDPSCDTTEKTEVNANDLPEVGKSKIIPGTECRISLKRVDNAPVHCSPTFLNSKKTLSLDNGSGNFEDHPIDIKDEIMDMEEDLEVASSAPSAHEKPLSQDLNSKVPAQSHIFKKEIRIILSRLVLTERKSSKRETANKSERKRQKVQVKGNNKYKCSHCDLSFRFMRSLRVHKNIHNNNTLKTRIGFIYPCGVCGQKFNFKYKLKMHTANTHPELADETVNYPFQCKKCEKRFRFSWNLEVHEKSHQENDNETVAKRQFQCTECGKAYQQPAALKRHLWVHTGIKAHSCDSCDESFNRKYKLIEHQKIHIKEFNFPCGRCEEKFKIELDLTKHKKEHQKSDFLTENDKGICFKCGICSQSFDKNDSEYFVEHMFFHQEENKRKCKLCDLKFSSEVLRNKHYDEDHINGFECHLCGQKLRRHKYLKKHIKTVHAEKKDFVCEICGMTFTIQALLTRHRHAIHDKRSLRCDHCPNLYTSIISLEKHVKTVHRKEVTCEYCGKSFGTSASLKLHLRQHTGDRPLKCSLCADTFAVKATLEKHMRKCHNAQKFQCKDCGRQFNAKINLTLHMRTHTGEKPYECSVCHKRFDRKQNLTTHFRFHSGEKPYKCGGCGKSFSRKDNLNTHVRKCQK